MTTDEIKKQLKQYRRVRDEREQLRERIEAKRADMNYLRAVVSDGGIRGSGVSDTVERAVELMDGLINCYALKAAECEEAETRVLGMIELAPEGLCRNILELRYIDGVEFGNIPDKLYISDRTMWNYYNAAIERICSEMQ